MSRIAIIGAGVSGLTMARLLRPKHDVRVFETAGKPGGLIRCKRVNGSLFHTCGGHVFNTKRQNVLDWFWSIFDRDKEFTKAVRNSAVCMDGGLTVPYPIENHIYAFDHDTQRKIIGDILTTVNGGG